MNGYDINDGNYLQKMFIDQVKPCLNGGGGAGGGDIDALIDKSITEISSNATSVSAYVLYRCSALTTANFPVATSIGAYAFSNCSKLTTADFPVATSIGEYAFSDCSKLTTADFPAVTRIDSRAFQNCSALITANFPVVTSISGYAFQYCSGLTTVNLPAATSIGNGVFRYCSNLTTVNISMATSISVYAFDSCGLKALILRSETRVTLSDTSAFTNTPIASGTGYIYVPRTLIETYKDARNWSTYAAQFRALEDYTVDGTTTGALDESKI